MSKLAQGIPASLIDNIAQTIEQARGQVRKAVNQAMVMSYWQVGQLIVEYEQQGQQRAEYGKQQLKQLSQQLTQRLGRGFDVTNLRNMRRFYKAFPIRETVSLELSWSHYNLLSRIENTNARGWYQQEALQQNWSVRALERQINKLYYERLLASKERALVELEAQAHTQPLAETVTEYLRDPYILDFLNLQDKTYQENQLEQAIISNLQQFLLELGKGFAFVERQQRIRFEDEDFYIDLVFYNFKLKYFLLVGSSKNPSFPRRRESSALIFLGSRFRGNDESRVFRGALVDLKLGKLKHQDVGQMDTYVRLYDQEIKGADDNPTIGLVLCSEKSEAVVKYSVLADQQQLFAAKYLPYLPSEEELKAELQREREQVMAQLALKPEGDDE